MIKKSIRLVSILLADPIAFFLARRAIKRFGAIQRTWELAQLIHEVRRRRPAVVVEIGTHRGGTLMCWAAVARANAQLVSIDIPNFDEGIGSTAADEERFRSFLKPKQSLTTLRSDSHAVETLEALAETLNTTPIDFLWIDGDHSDRGVRLDWSMYEPLVRSTGLIAFHDINPNPGFPQNQAHVFWQELRQGRDHSEFVDQPWGKGMGIGIIKKH